MVASYSPHRHHGETAALFSRPPPKSPSHRLIHSPSCPSPFAIPLSPIAKARSAVSRRSTPINLRNGTPVDSTSPLKLPLSSTTANDINSGKMTLRSELSSPRSSHRSSPRQKPLSSRPTRSHICSPRVTNRGPGSSPLKRTDSVVNFGQLNEGSPTSKRKSSHFGLFQMENTLQKAQDTVPPHSSNVTPKKNNTSRKASGHVFQKPSFIRSRAQPSQLTDSSGRLNEARIRRISSVETMAARDSPFNTRNGPLPNASIHTQLGHIHNLHPLSHHIVHSQFQKPVGTYTDWETPVNYKAARPNPAAFHSTGFVSKRGRMLNSGKEHGPQPDTPCKRSNLFPGSTFQPKATGSRIRMREFGSPQTPVPEPGSMNHFLNRRDSMVSNEGDESPDFFERRSRSNIVDIDLPPTPTKAAASKNPSRNFGDDIFKINKRARIEGSESKFRHAGRLNPQPQTPKNDIVPPDPSSLSISGKPNEFSKRRSLPAHFPFTPARENFLFGLDTPPFLPNTVPSFNGNNHQVTSQFKSRFTDIKHVGSGAFSEVYQVTEKRSVSDDSNFLSSSQLVTPRSSSVSGLSSSPVACEPPLQAYAVKKAKSRFLGPRDRTEKKSEALILKSLKKHRHIVEYIDDWVEDDILYIQTEYCENGSLDKFLELHGNKGRLDEFRVWKIILELCLGVRHIHDSGFMHLDLKPANVLIALDGSLKISDFGMALKWPAPRDLEREGDREYIAPEVLAAHKYDKPVDIFALGLTIIETAGNEALPPNGPEWQSLRNGDLSVAPILSTISSGEYVHRDEEGNPIGTEIIDLNQQNTGKKVTVYHHPGARKGSTIHNPRPGDLIDAPALMMQGALEAVVRLMISKEPADRPTANELLSREEMRWVAHRRQTTATVFEGLWGPDDKSVEKSKGTVIPESDPQIQASSSVDWDMDLL